MKTEGAIPNFWGAQAASLQFAAACREHSVVFSRSVAAPNIVRPASCRAVQAGSLRSPERNFVDDL
jgi:hypothetical protein